MTFPNVSYYKAWNLLQNVSERIKIDQRMHDSVIFYEDEQSAFFYSRSPKSNFGS